LFTLKCGDSLKLMKELPENSIDLIITDPPYLKEFLYTYEYLAEESPRILKDGGSLLMIVGHFAIPQVVKYFDGKMKYRWMMWLNQCNGQHPRMAMGIEVLWKPVLWYVKRAYPSGRGFIRDGVEITGKAGQKKKLHKWEQDPSWCEYFITKLCPEGGTVLDPYMGSGSTGEAAIKNKRKFIGFDIEKEYVDISKTRLAQAVGS